MKPMKLEDRHLTKRNPGASEDLIIPIRLDAALTDDQEKQNCSENIKRKIAWLNTIPEHDGVAIICGSAPSLQDSYKDILDLKKSGATVFACNASARLLHKNGIGIDYQVIADGLDWAFYDLFHEVKAHLLASILPGKFFDAVENPVMWHPYTKSVVSVVEGVDKEFAYIGGGVTVSLFTLCIAYTMGFREIHCFGMDSSFQGESHHAENCSEKNEFTCDVEFDGKIYPTTYDMKTQAHVFVGLEKLLNESGAEVIVHGCGLLPDVWKKIVSDRAASRNLTT